MALAAPPHITPEWARWPQEQHAGQHYGMIGQTMMPYDGRPMPLAPLQRPGMEPVYVVPPPAYQPPHVHNLDNSPFDTQVQYGFGHYATAPHTPQPSQESTPPPQSSFAPSPVSDVGPRHSFSGPTQHAAPVAQHAASLFHGFNRDQRHFTHGHHTPSPTPSVKCESENGKSLDPTTGHKTITTNISMTGSLQAEFHTSIDELMKTIQSKTVKKEEEEDVSSPVQHVQMPTEVVAVQSEMPRQELKAEQKKHVCTVPECGRRFSQKTHLDMHLRSHSNVRPYVCKWAGCGKRVSQLGNLRTHERRHTGEKPFQCKQCGKRFAQRGNVRAHENVHLNQKPFQCILDDCNKRFSQRGNLKSHQNHFHAETLQKLTVKFAKITSSENISPEDQDFLEYFAKLYKNSNKGIKGRGKACKIATRAPISPPASAQMSPVSPMDNTVHITPAPQQQHQTYGYSTVQPMAQLPLPHYAPPSNQGYYGVHQMSTARPVLAINPHVNEAMPHAGYHHQYRGSFDDGSVSSATTTLYEGDHGRNDLAFGDRMY